MKRYFLPFSFSLFSFIFCAAQEVSTLAGSTQGFADGTGTAAQFNNPNGVVADSNGNVYVGDYQNHKIRKITPDGVVTTLAGSTQGYADGPGASAKFNFPYHVVVDSQGNLFVADTNNQKIRKISPSGVVTTFAGSLQGYLDGTGTAARFNAPLGMAIDSNDNLYVCDTYNYKIRKITPTGVVTTVAGSTLGYADGTGSAAQFNRPMNIALDSNNNLYVSDAVNQKIRKISPSGVVTTFAGSTQGYVNGSGLVAQFSNPHGIAVDSYGNIFVADFGNGAIRKIISDGTVSTLTGGTIAGNLDGPCSIAQFRNVMDVAVDLNGNMYIADETNNNIRKITQYLSYNENQIDSFKIYPNPVSQILNIQLPENTELLNTSIYNLLGQIIKTGNRKEIEVNDLSRGCYFIKVVTDKGNATKRFIVE